MSTQPAIADLIPYLTDEELRSLEFLTAERQRFDGMTTEEQRLESIRNEAGKTPAAFFRSSWGVLEPGKSLEWSWHYDMIGEHLEAVYLGQLRRVIINVPPRTAKSTFCTISFPAWCWTRNKALSFLTASYSSDLSSDHSVKRRRLMESAWYQSLWPVHFTRDTNRQDQYRNTGEGEMIATSVGASATGRGGDILILDDAMNAEEARSKAAQTKLHSWFPNVFRSRLNDPATGAIIVIEQRTNESDMTGWLLRNEPGQWTHIVVPTEAEERKEFPFPISKKIHTREIGDVLQPKRHTPEVIRTRKIHTRTWATQDQQRPAPDSGIVFMRKWWQYRKGLRARYDQIVTSWDFAVEGNADSDFNAGVCLGKAGADIDVIDVFAERLPFPQQQQALVNFRNKHPYATRHLVEKKANGSAIIASLRSKVGGLIAVEPQGSKLQRADASTPECEAGNVFLIEAEWNHDFVEHMVVFPNGLNDDIVDAFSQGINWLRGHNYQYGLLAVAAEDAAAAAAGRETYLQNAKMIKPDTGLQAIDCEKCGSKSVVRIGNSYRCNGCSHTWAAIKTPSYDHKIVGRGGIAPVRK